MLWLFLLFCGLTLAQDDSNSSGTSCSPACDLPKEFDAIKEKLVSLETRLNDMETMKRQAENAKVIFSAATGGGGSRIGPFSEASILVYRTVFTNIGDAYNETSGVFTAPVAGVYYFSFSYHAGGAHGTRLALLKNSRTIIMSGDQQSQADKTGNGGNTVFLQLQQGDQVHMQMAADTQVWGSDYHTTFSAFLVSQM
ncbi:complement C1q-like protein 4 isoform X2 [Cheilinus undulatus]|uniref:complement C1q-like protein 4 isoform X2 n=1 Tax=Cheilinus undulatus TaxID=241271 RepID=UPI001BD35AF1|nr:complement C1q-like protein 4 isoform X2 [Cheilinus undulatus]